ncbi:MAG: plasmid pRiA4b ORF-3 family protein [Panacibacter sp.]
MNKILQLKIDLAFIRPAITRTVLVPDDYSFYNLHHVIQICMGWANCHLFAFREKEYVIEIPHEFDDEDLGFGTRFKKIDPRNILLNEYFNAEKVKIKYEYDFGDSWEHFITLQKIIQPEKDKVFPLCIKAKRNCPPEDCGGFPGYMHLIEIMQKNKSREYKEMVEWLGGEFDPEEVDIESINDNLCDIDNYITEYEG